MKTIEPNSEEDLINQYFIVPIELDAFHKNRNGILTPTDWAIIETYKNIVRFLEKNIKDQKLYN